VIAVWASIVEYRKRQTATAANHSEEIVTYFVGLDVSLEETAICIVDDAGAILREGKVETEPEAVSTWLTMVGEPIERLGLEAGPLSPWLCEGLQAAGLPAVCIETRRMKGATAAMAMKTDRNDARAIAQAMRVGWFTTVHVKTAESQEMRLLLTNRKTLLTSRVTLENEIRGTLKAFGLKVGRVSVATFEPRGSRPPRQSRRTSRAGVAMVAPVRVTAYGTCRMRTLYKFVGSQMAVRAMAGGSLKFTTIAELNDPSELVPHMDREAVLASLVTMRMSGYTPEQFEWLGCQEALLRLISPETRVLSRPSTIDQANRTLALPVYDNLDFMERQLLKTISLIRSRVGVLSLTERFDSLPMWAHYGALAKGYVIRLDGLDSEFPKDPTGSLNVVKPVNYVEDLVGMTHDPSTQDNLFFSKFRDWSYEREWRVVSALSSCQLSANGKMHLRYVRPSIVTGVICGWNAPDEDVRSLVAELSTNPHLEMFVASLERGRVRLQSLHKS
jgi:hypothetical protein